MGMGLVDGFREAVRALLGLPTDPGQPPDLMRLGLYRAKVLTCASDGSACDVLPDDERISAEKNVQVRVGIPGAVAVVQPGAFVLLGWERGDPGSPYCVPSWESSAVVTKLVVNAQMVYLGAEAGAEALVKKSDYDSHTHSIPSLSVSGSATGTGVTGGAAAATGTSKLKAV